MVGPTTTPFSSSAWAQPARRKQSSGLSRHPLAGEFCASERTTRAACSRSLFGLGTHRVGHLAHREKHEVRLGKLLELRGSPPLAALRQALSIYPRIRETEALCRHVVMEQALRGVQNFRGLEAGTVESSAVARTISSRAGRIRIPGRGRGWWCRTAASGPCRRRGVAGRARAQPAAAR